MSDPSQVPFDNRPQYVVVGRYSDGSGHSEQVYGPYSEDVAERVAAELDGGAWQRLMWEKVPLVLTPWERC
ncbi:hypothetical protein [Parafrankia soli]|uniref:hypothetical protein n=1 Tax=Parafrankia soli TaxID=2599596 RepID=UPI0010425293|nr:hypothetical protein [Parafrankia soli]